MSERKTLRRLGVAAVGAATFLATPAMGVGSAFADEATLEIVSPWLGDSGEQTDGIVVESDTIRPVSTLNDGTNTTIHLEAQLNQATEDDIDVASVRFRFRESTPANSPAVTIATDSSAPYAAEWNPPDTVEDGENVDLIYEGLAANGTTVVTTSEQTVVYESQNDSVHITQPATGGQIGAWNHDGTQPPTAIMKGTASEETTVSAFALNEGAEGDTADDALFTRQPGTDFAEYGEDTWSAIVPVTGTNTPSNPETFGAIAGEGESDEDTQATVYAQTLASADFTVTPAEQTEAADADTEETTDEEFVVRAEDQNGNPIGALNVIISDAAGDDDDGDITITRGYPTTDALGEDAPEGVCANDEGEDGQEDGLCVLTDENGEVRFNVTLTSPVDPDTETSDDVRVQTDIDFNGLYNGAEDEQRDVTYTVYEPEVDALTLEALPDEESYSSQEYTAVCDNTMDNNAPNSAFGCDASDEDADDINYTNDANADTATSPQGGTPLVRVLIEDQNGNPMVNRTITNLVYRVDRTYDAPAESPARTNTQDDIPNTACDATEGPNGSDTEIGSCTTDQHGYIYLPHWHSFDKDGSDEFHVWQELNGTPGEGVGDIAAAALTLDFSFQQLFWVICEDTQTTYCNTQTETDQDVTYTVRSERGGQPNAGEELEIQVEDSDDATDPDLFTPTQPAGTTFVSTTLVTCTTNAEGECTVRVNRDSGQDAGENFDDEIAPGQNEPAELRATDEAGRQATLNVDFRNYNIAIGGSEGRSARLIAPDVNLPPGNSEFGGIYIGNPGDVIGKGYRLYDTNGNRLYHVTGDVSVEDGYFVNEPEGCNGINCPHYDDFEFVPEPEDGDQIGAPEPANGTEANSRTLGITTDNSGKFHFYISIQRDNDFDDNGQVSVDAEIDGTGGLPGGVGLPNPGTAGGESDLDDVDNGPNTCDGPCDDFDTTWTTDGNIYRELDFIGFQGAGEELEWRYGYHNPAATNPIVVVEDSGDNLSGNTPTAQERRVFIFTRDQFGNLTRPYAEFDVDCLQDDPETPQDESQVCFTFVDESQIHVNVDGVGAVRASNQESDESLPVLSSFTDEDYRFGVRLVNDDPPAQDNQFHFRDGTAGNQTASVTWDAHSYNWVEEENETSGEAQGEFDNAVAPSEQEPPLSADYNPPADSENDGSEIDCDSLVDNHPECDEGETAALTRAFANLTWYIQAVRPEDGATYTITHTPAGNVHPVGTTVTERITARDQHNEPIVGLEVTFFGAGPGQGDCDTDEGCSSPVTNGQGRASYTYQGVFEGNTIITGVIFDEDGNEVERVVDRVGFDDTPRLSAESPIVEGQKATLSGDTRPGASVRLQRNPAGPAGWSNSGKAKTAQNDGEFTFKRSPKTNGKYRVRVDGIVNSAPDRVKVFVDVNLTASSPSNDTVRLRANMKDRHQGATVRFFRIVNGDRNLLGVDTAGGNGNAVLVHQFNNNVSGNELRFRARVLPQTRNAKTWSNFENQVID